MTRLLSRLGLPTPELRAWAMYDWANSAFWSTIVTAVFPAFFASYAAAGLSGVEATSRFAWGTTLALTIVALTAPVLGALADHRPLKKRLLLVFLLVGVAATELMATIGRGEWLYALVLFMVANIGVASTLVFYDSLLPHLAAPDQIDRASTAGYAIGFTGGGILLLINLAWIMKPALFGLADTTAAVRLTFVSVGVWWLVFSLPLFRRVPEPAIRLEDLPASGLGLAVAAAAASWKTFNGLRRNRHAFLMLVAFLLYNDGIQTLIRMSSIYGTEVGVNQNAQIAAFVLVQFVGVPCSFLFGAFAGRIGAKAAIFAALAVYVGVSVLGYFMTTSWQFFVLATLVGTVQGGSQALSRSLFARMTPPAKSSEYFSFFAVFEKFAGIFGPLFFGASVTLFQSSRAAVLSVIFFFVAGAIVLSFVDVEAGEAATRSPHGS
ncbi:MAG TPA: MFS transporter [Vicinamibacterales bacterium]|nr:MFS transporter [Vicinamibacterales bacterium]